MTQLLPTLCMALLPPISVHALLLIEDRSQDSMQIPGAIPTSKPPQKSITPDSQPLSEIILTPPGSALAFNTTTASIPIIFSASADSQSPLALQNPSEKARPAAPSIESLTTPNSSVEFHADQFFSSPSKTVSQSIEPAHQPLTDPLGHRSWMRALTSAINAYSLLTTMLLIGLLIWHRKHHPRKAHSRALRQSSHVTRLRNH